MAKAKLEVRILDADKVEAIKDLINELLDTNETLRGILCECKDNWDENQTVKKRKEYIDRFADIIADEGLTKNKSN